MIFYRYGRIVLKRFFGALSQFPLIWSFTHDARSTKKCAEILHAFSTSVIRDRRKALNAQRESSQKTESTTNEEDDLIGKRKRLSFLDMILQASTPQGEPLSDSDIREEVDTFMFEGHDTTTSGLCFTIYNLAKNPDIQQRAFEELREIMGEDPSTPCSFKSLHEMKYLEKVIKESLRLFPSVPLVARELIVPMTLQGVTIPPGNQVIVNLYNLHRNEKVSTAWIGV